jgi:membrane protein DedA with SNARE-associated domain
VGGLLDSAASLASPWAYVVLGLLAAAESAAFVGLAIPGETAMLLGGVLASRGRVSLGVMMAAGAIGAVVGDSIGYEIGRVAGRPLKDSRLGRRVGQARWDKAEAYLRAKGGRAVFLARFVGVLRALVPALAGMSGMPYRTFLPWNLAGGIIWAPGFVLLGYLAGGSYQRVERIAGRASLLLLLLLVLAAAVVGAARWLARHPQRGSRRSSSANSPDPRWPACGSATAPSSASSPAGCDQAGRWACRSPSPSWRWPGPAGHSAPCSRMCWLATNWPWSTGRPWRSWSPTARPG